MKNSNTIIVVLTTLLLSACGGTKVLKEPAPLPEMQPLATASDQTLSATLDWVIVRDSAGTWARKANWDEYLLRVSNQSEQPLQVTEVVVVDSLGTRIESPPGRKQLVKGSKNNEKRYKEAGVTVSAGAGTDALYSTGVAAAAGGALLGAAAGGSAYVGAGAAATVGAAVVLAPVLAVGGVMRGVNNSAVNKQIEKRKTLLPLDVTAGGEVMLDVFFPIAPSPGMVELSYSDASGEHIVVIDTSVALNGLHIESSAE